MKVSEIKERTRLRTVAKIHEETQVSKDHLEESKNWIDFISKGIVRMIERKDFWRITVQRAAVVARTIEKRGNASGRQKVTRLRKRYLTSNFSWSMNSFSKELLMISTLKR